MYQVLQLCPVRLKTHLLLFQGVSQSLSWAFLMTLPFRGLVSSVGACMVVLSHLGYTDQGHEFDFVYFFLREKKIPVPCSLTEKYVILS